LSEDVLGLFEGYGIELEYMIVAGDDLDVRPIADELLKQLGGGYELEVENGDIAWSNELALHVVELKTNGPTPALAGVEARFDANIRQVNELLEPMGARLMPTAMHPWMDPHRDLKLWPHENDVIYRTFDRIFDCRGHGWANLQSAHINLPFANDREFGALHSAIRLVLPLIPGLAASSPFVEGRATGLCDTRLEYYRTNAARIPSVSGQVVPEPVHTRAEYENHLLGRIYRDLAPHDPDGVLRHEWANARGAIARFDRMAIEIRIVDLQERPAADIAVAAAVVAAVRCLVEEHWSSAASQRDWDTRELAAYLADATRAGDQAVIESKPLLASFGYPERGRARLGELWQHLVEALLTRDAGYPAWAEPLATIVERGCLARRILDVAGPEPSRERLGEIYGALADCLAAGRGFAP